MLQLHHVPSSYRHHTKRAEPHDRITIAATELKSYQISRQDQPVPGAIASDATASLTSAMDKIGLDADRGFVILHRCGLDFYFLLVTVWRGANEAWEAVYYRDGSMDRFAPFEPAYPPATAPLRPTFCIWELGVVAHEAKAWSRFLASPRSEADEAIWRNDVMTGEV